MMNRPSSTDPYAPSLPFMPFAAGLEASSSVHSQHQHQQQQLWDWEANTSCNYNSYPFLPPSSSFLDCQPPLVPTGSLPFYSPAAVPGYDPAAMKSEEERGRIGLNLGHRTYFQSGGGARPAPGVYALAHQPPRCQAEGCKADLSAAKHYHRRHKVCELHSKATVVVAGGMQQRFCQQCSRFHVLSEFDEAKRSCRKRLADHNRRRRKPQPQPQLQPPTDSSSSSSAPNYSKDNNSSTATRGSAYISAAACSLEEGQQGNINQGNGEQQMRNIGSAALSLGGMDGLYSSSSSLFHHHSLFCSSSNEEASHESTGGGGSEHTHSHSHSHSHQQSSSNLLHLGQALFEVDFM